MIEESEPWHLVDRIKHVPLMPGVPEELSYGINSKGLETLQYQKYTLLESCTSELSLCKNA